jgi:hypothetical protein
MEMGGVPVRSDLLQKICLFNFPNHIGCVYFSGLLQHLRYLFAYLKNRAALEEARVRFFQGLPLEVRRVYRLSAAYLGL